MNSSRTKNQGTSLSLSQVHCKEHGKQFLALDRTNFKVICTKCDNPVVRDLEFTLNYKDNFDEDEFITCMSHQNIKGTFYCDDCKDFLCKVCIANEHRNHNSNMPEEIVKQFKESLLSAAIRIGAFKPELDGALAETTALSNQISAIRDAVIARVKEFTASITKTLGFTIERRFSIFLELFNGLNKDVETAYETIKTALSKTRKSIVNLNEIYAELKSRNNSVVICNYTKTKKKEINEAESLVDSKTSKLYEINVKELKDGTDECSNEYNDFIQKFDKKNSLFKKSILSSLSSGLSNKSYSIRRFNKVHIDNLKYFKNSSLDFRVSSPCILTGVALCGLILTKNEMESIITNHTKMPSIAVTVSIRNAYNEIVLYESGALKGIFNLSDPVIRLNFEKCVQILEDHTYSIQVTNEDDNSYVSIYCGEVPDEFLQGDNQKIICNNSGKAFNFIMNKELESDFNEFNLGIISDLIYTYVE